MERKQEFSNSSKIIYDWLSFTSKTHSPEDIMKMLDIKDANWQLTKGAHGYQDRWYYECISIHFNGHEDMGVWCEMSGQGCRAYETVGRGDFEYLFNLIKSNENIKITRLDVAFDDHEGILDINKLCNDARKSNFVSVFDACEVRYSTKGNSILHGSKKSEIIIRIYDKAKERNCEEGTHWIRIEIQMRRDRALQFISQTNEKQTIGYMFCGVLNNYLRYVSPDKNDNNKWRWKTRKYWQNLLEHTKRIKLYEKPGMDYNMLHLHNYVINQAGGAIDTYIEIKGIWRLIDELGSRETTENPKYKRLKEEYKEVIEKRKNAI